MHFKNQECRIGPRVEQPRVWNSPGLPQIILGHFCQFREQTRTAIIKIRLYQRIRQELAGLITQIPAVFLQEFDFSTSLPSDILNCGAPR